jgi:hypothetical protein
MSTAAEIRTKIMAVEFSAYEKHLRNACIDKIVMDGMHGLLGHGIIVDDIWIEKQRFAHPQGALFAAALHASGLMPARQFERLSLAGQRKLMKHAEMKAKSPSPRDAKWRVILGTLAAMKVADALEK